jgi:hypothetical protein
MNAPASITITPVRVADLLAEGERMPVYVHVIDHPDARVLVDTGMTELHPAVADLDPRLRPLSKQDFDLAGFTYAIGLGLALAIGFVTHYVATLPLYIGLLGIVWTGTHVGWGRRRVVDLLVEVEAAFRGGSTHYPDEAIRWLRRMLNVRYQSAAALLAIVITWAYVWIAIRSTPLPWFPSRWSFTGPDLLARTVILFIYAIPVLVLAVSAVVFIAVFTLFVLDLRTLESTPVLPAALALLRPLAEFGLTLSIAWSVGASLFVIFFRPQPTIGTISLVAGLGLVAFLILFAPQFAIHRILVRTRAQLLDSASTKFTGCDVARNRKQADEELPVDHREAFVGDQRWQEMAKAVDWITSARTWPYGFSGLAPLLTPIILPIGVLVLRAVLGD